MAVNSILIDQAILVKKFKKNTYANAFVEEYSRTNSKIDFYFHDLNSNYNLSQNKLDLLLLQSNPEQILTLTWIKSINNELSKFFLNRESLEKRTLLLIYAQINSNKQDKSFDSALNILVEINELIDDQNFKDPFSFKKELTGTGEIYFYLKIKDHIISHSPFFIVKDNNELVLILNRVNDFYKENENYDNKYLFISKQKSGIYNSKLQDKDICRLLNILTKFREENNSFFIQNETIQKTNLSPSQSTVEYFENSKNIIIKTIELLKSKRPDYDHLLQMSALGKPVDAKIINPYKKILELKELFYKNGNLTPERFELLNHLLNNSVKKSIHQFINHDFNYEIRIKLLKFYTNVLENADNNEPFVKIILNSLKLSGYFEFDESIASLVDELIIKDSFTDKDKKYLGIIKSLFLKPYFDTNKSQGNFKWLADETTLYLESQEGVCINNLPSFEGLVKPNATDLNIKGLNESFIRILEKSTNLAQNVKEAFDNGKRKFAFIERVNEIHYELSFLIGSELFKHDLAKLGFELTIVNWNGPLPSINGNGGCLLHSIAFCLQHIQIKKISTTMI